LKPNQKIIVVSPAFFGFERNICEEIEKLGHSCIWMNERPYEQKWFKILTKIAPFGARKIGEHRILQEIARLKDFGEVDQVLIIKAESQTLGTMKCFKRAFPKATMVLYLWDSVKNSPNGPRLSTFFDRIYTFDPLDAQDYNFSYRPLFAVRSSKPSGLTDDSRARNLKNPCIYFVGTGRFERVLRLAGFLRSNKGLSIRSHIFVNLTAQNVLYQIFSALLRVPSGVKFSTKKLSYDDYITGLSNSSACIDFEHPKQSGVTMRSIETLLYGKKLITSNSHIKTLKLYHPNRVFIAKDVSTKVPLDFFSSDFPEVSSNLNREFSLKGWLGDVLQL
jgi:hypothetical protein